MEKSIHKPELKEVYEPKQTERLEIILTRQSFVVVDLVHLFLRKTERITKMMVVRKSLKIYKKEQKETARWS